MFHYLQEYNAMDRTWKRGDAKFTCALDALEARDEAIGDWDNDGVERGCRVVDDLGNVIEYGFKTV